MVLILDLVSPMFAPYQWNSGHFAAFWALLTRTWALIRLYSTAQYSSVDVRTLLYVFVHLLEVFVSLCLLAAQPQNLFVSKPTTKLWLLPSHDRLMHFYI